MKMSDLRLPEVSVIAQVKPLMAWPWILLMPWRDFWRPA